MLGVSQFDNARESACTWARCPICFDALHTRPGDVGALTYKGKRVESALYHQSCMMDERGELRLSASLTPPWHRSPVSRLAVDGFALLPPISKRISWTKFVDWNGDGVVDLSEVAAAIAAVLPVDEAQAERFVSAQFDKDGNGVLDAHEIRSAVLPFLRKSMAHIVESASRPPEIHACSSRADFLSWFDHWDRHGAGHLTSSCLQLAVVTSLHNGGTLQTRRMVAAVIIAEAELEEALKVSRAIFLERLVPVMQMNLPAKGVQGGALGDPWPCCFDPKKPMTISLISTDGKRKQALVPPTATVGTLRAEARRQYRVWLGSKDARLCMAGKLLHDDCTPVSALPFNLEGGVVQVIPMVKVVLTKVKPVECESTSDGDASDCSWSSSEDDSGSCGGE